MRLQFHHDSVLGSVHAQAECDQPRHRRCRMIMAVTIARESPPVRTCLASALRRSGPRPPASPPASSALRARKVGHFQVVMAISIYYIIILLDRRRFAIPPPPALDKTGLAREVAASSPHARPMPLLTVHSKGFRSPLRRRFANPSGIVSLDDLYGRARSTSVSAVINGSAKGLMRFATGPQFPRRCIAGQIEKSMIVGATSRRVKLYSVPPSKNLHRLARSLASQCACFRRPVIARCPAGASVGGLEFAAACTSGLPRRRRFGMPRQGRYSQRDPCSAVTLACRLGPRPLAGSDPRKYRRAYRACVGAWSTWSRRKVALTRGLEHGGGSFEMRSEACARKIPAPQGGQTFRLKQSSTSALAYRFHPSDGDPHG